MSLRRVATGSVIEFKLIRMILSFFGGFMSAEDCSGPLPRSPFCYMVVTDPSHGRAAWHAPTTLTPAKHLQVVSKR